MRRFVCSVTIYGGSVVNRLKIWYTYVCKA